ncbi:galactitol-1-phosphate 5-dehydrogenase [Actinomadura viridis]|uniref:galactitol-1-phosphate 5-dehydrogenase n=1 Tax=Actinomadura viridis TaxID=58110 RepID=UPI0036971DC9
MPEKMLAAVLHAPGDIRVEEVPRPEPGPGEALVRVEACGVCGSDIARMLTAGAHRMPVICGHEFSGRVVETGPGVSGAAVGDLVSVPPLIPCRVCSECQRGRFSLCLDYDYFGSRRDGAYAGYVTVPAGNLFTVPEQVPAEAAAMIDPAAIALHAIWRTRLGIGSRVAVVGAGPIGLFAVQWARLAGASDVLAIDLNDRKLAQAAEAGATHTASLAEEARDLAGDGYDVVVESAGAPVTADLAASLCARHGEAVFIGIPHAPVELAKGTFNDFLRREVSLHGAWNSFSAPFPGDEWRATADAMASGALRWKFMITHELGLEAVPETMKQLGERSIFSSKVLFLPGAGT